jgi:predicted  nucleic acid-binding Zn-ribbon protein
LNKDLEQLVQLSKYDVAIVEFEPKIANENAKLNTFLKNANKLNEEIEELYKVIDDSKNKSIKNDIHLKHINQKLQEIASKTKIVKTEKEIKALVLEEEIAKEQINFANQEIARLNDITTAKESELLELKESLAKEEEDIKEIQETINKTIKELEAKKAEISKKRNYLFEKVDKKVLTFYEKIRRWAKETAVVPVKNQACYGCHMKITDRIYYDFITSDEIKNCPHCGRIIYKEEVEQS